MLVDINGDHLKQVHQECTQILQDVQQQQKNNYWSNYIVADITNKTHVFDMVEYADSLAKESQQERHQVLNGSSNASILINAAGITRDGLIHNIKEEDYDHVLNTNLKGTFLTCQAFCDPKRLDQILAMGKDRNESIASDEGDMCMFPQSASIVNIGSIVSELGNIGQTNYAASKGGVIGLTRSLAKEMAYYVSAKQKLAHDSDAMMQNQPNPNRIKERLNIRVNAILPGFIDTPMSNAVPDDVKARIRAQIPLQDFGSVDDIANMTLFLSSSRSSYVTGSTFECSGMISL